MSTINKDTVYVGEMWNDFWGMVTESKFEEFCKFWNGELWNGEFWNGEFWYFEFWNSQIGNGEIWNVEFWNGGF